MISLTQKLNKLIKMEGNVVMAEEVQVFEIELIEVTKILIKYKEDDKVFFRYLHENDEWWQENKHMFQDNFNLFFNILNDTFIKNKTDIHVNIIKKSINTIILHIKYSDVFSFEVNIELQTPRSLEELERENKMLKEAIRDIKDKLK